MLENRCIVDRGALGGHDVLKRAFATAVLIAIAVACSPSPSEPLAVQSQAQPRWLTLPPPLPLPAAVLSSSAHVDEIDLHYFTYGDTKAPPPIFLHGGMGNSENWGNKLARSQGAIA